MSDNILDMDCISNDYCNSNVIVIIYNYNRNNNQKSRCIMYFTF